MLPDLIIALLVFVLFLFGAGRTRRLAQHLNTSKHANLGAVLGCMTQ